MEKVKLKSNGEKDVLIGTYFIYPPRLEERKYEDLSISQIEAKIFKKYGPKYIKTIRKAIS